MKIGAVYYVTGNILHWKAMINSFQVIYKENNKLDKFYVTSIMRVFAFFYLE